MNIFEHYLFSLSEAPISILDNGIPLNKYTSLDLSETNKELKGVKITNPDACQIYIEEEVLNKDNALVAYGGYLEKRNIYADKSSFSGNEETIRNIHLGIDYWAKAGTNVIVPLEGVVHSFKNNNTSGDYGPTIILEHNLKGEQFYTLYGHLSIESLNNIVVGELLTKGDVLAQLGTPDINVNYAPHLHFQVIKDLGNYKGDYPGVCNQKDTTFYRNNCPNPNLLIKL
ncbi:peptidoglycan DD-metalloendopeptidase family protein [Cellulophaga baltica]|uniref:peptidoglycan DD-metalloendopeptidase family protein n=1 Tax=Cellulophaga TaxID=104264 RepID=UPI001C06B61C|nr:MULTISPECIES: peptidoglycan DD-metalloendopeptidase family protein [Cellulophaga]MBU2996567.1 peptidoglycan DD-metalloendopeptidase family protein [Cellulophaga baltica]MDO6767961.1 peptidoglycan DD-metalloendopeptidase family protein [Cellulophaga sp. 1_MG-2023]